MGYKVISLLQAGDFAREIDQLVTTTVHSEWQVSYVNTASQEDRISLTHKTKPFSVALELYKNNQYLIPRIWAGDGYTSGFPGLVNSSYNHNAYGMDCRRVRFPCKLIIAFSNSYFACSIVNDSDNKELNVCATELNGLGQREGLIGKYVTQPGGLQGNGSWDIGSFQVSHTQTGWAAAHKTSVQQPDKKWYRQLNGADPFKISSPFPHPQGTYSAFTHDPQAVDLMHFEQSATTIFVPLFFTGERQDTPTGRELFFEANQIRICATHYTRAGDIIEYQTQKWCVIPWSEFPLSGQSNLKIGIAYQLSEGD
ncbi:hypothetical protein [Vibrio cholerae]|uniref:hypothetical protein n=1 Tax=Vibrio cholerae TaxID=666 RepID=UPI0035308FAF